MKTDIIRTDLFYREIIDTPDMAEKTRLYLDNFVAPWEQMMSMVVPMLTGDDSPPDPLAGARAWNWLLPEELTDIPPSFARLLDADVWAVADKALKTGVDRFKNHSDKIPFDHVTGWLIAASPDRADPVMQGATGACDWFQPRLILQYDTPTERNLRSLPGMVVHEFHHLIRLRVFPWNMMTTTVADYIIHEGLAESFAAACFGDDVLGHYVTDFDESQLETARNLIRDGLDKTGFDMLRGYIFGDYWAEKLGFASVGMPTYGGYAIGYRVVQAFLARTGTSIEETTFLPADQIVRESGFFDK